MTDDLLFLKRPIEDWSLEGRRAFVEEHRWSIINALDEAFMTFLDGDVFANLEDFGFGKSRDPIKEAVDFCLERFENGDIDESKIYPAHRGCVLFTRVEFWLAQKVGKQAYKRIRAERIAHANTLVYEHEAVDKDTPSAGELFANREFTERLFAVMPVFVERVGRDMLGAWLVGTAGMRGALFGWGDVPQTPPHWSDKKRSVLIADALFRLLDVYFKDLEPVDDLSMDRAAYELCTRAPFDDSTNYRRSDRSVGDVLARGVREITRARKRAVVALSRKRLDDLGGDNLSFWEQVLIRSSLRRSIVEAHRLDRTKEEISALIEDLDNATGKPLEDGGYE